MSERAPPASDARPSAAEALYGPDGPASGPSGAKAFVEAGIARPDPRFADERSPTRPGPGFDAARWRGGDQFDPQMMGECSSVAREMGLDQKGGERLIELHSRAQQAAEENYARKLSEGVDELARSLPAEDLAAARSLIADERFTPRELRPWLERWGNHPAIATMLTRWASAIRRGY